VPYSSVFYVSAKILKSLRDLQLNETVPGSGGTNRESFDSWSLLSVLVRELASFSWQKWVGRAPSLLAACKQQYRLAWIMCMSRWLMGSLLTSELLCVHVLLLMWVWLTARKDSQSARHRRAVWIYQQISDRPWSQVQRDSRQVRQLFMYIIYCRG